MMNKKPLAIVVLISGQGSNLQAIIEATRRDLPVVIKAVISNREAAFGLEHAKKAHIPTHCLSHQSFCSAAEFEAALIQVIDAYAPDLIVLAGFMRKLGADIVAHYEGQMINIHPALLPKYKGLHTHERVLAAGEREHGASVHFVTEALDAGPVIAQASLSLSLQDTVESLQTRVQQLEHVLYPTVLSWMAAGRVTFKGGQAYLDGVVLPPTGKTLTVGIGSSFE